MKNVTAAVIIKDNKILIAQRKKGSHLEYKWEFPGGKIEDGESAEECLERELFEEFNVITKTGDFITSNEFQYKDKKINLIAYYSEYISGNFTLNAHEELKWVSPNEISTYDFAEADIPVVQILEEKYENRN